jgi:hypothetical protein
MAESCPKKEKREAAQFSGFLVSRRFRNQKKISSAQWGIVCFPSLVRTNSMCHANSSDCALTIIVIGYTGPSAQNA